MGDEDLLTRELALAVGGVSPSISQKTFSSLDPKERARWRPQLISPSSPLRYIWKETDEWERGGPAATAFLQGGGRSNNIPRLRAAVRARKGCEDAVSFWEEVGAADYDAYMGQEWFSVIYDSFFFLSWVSLIDSPIPSLSRIGLDAASYHLALCRALEVDGRIYGIGQRSAGHLPKPGMREWLYAVATGGHPEISRAERWCKEKGEGLEKSWEYSAAQALLPALRRAGDISRTVSLHSRGYRRPVQIRRYEGGGLAAWIEPGDAPWSCDNGNTPPIVGVVRYQDGKEVWFPERGGEREKRVRQQFDECRISPAYRGNDGWNLVYESSIYGTAEGRLPGGVEESVMILGKRGAGLTPPPQSVPNPPTVPLPRPPALSLEERVGRLERVVAELQKRGGE